LDLPAWQSHDSIAATARRNGRNVILLWQLIGLYLRVGLFKRLQDVVGWNGVGRCSTVMLTETYCSTKDWWQRCWKSWTTWSSDTTNCSSPACVQTASSTSTQTVTATSSRLEELRKANSDRQVLEHTHCWRQALVDLTLWRPLLPYGYSYKASRARPG